MRLSRQNGQNRKDSTVEECSEYFLSGSTSTFLCENFGLTLAILAHAQVYTIAKERGIDAPPFLTLACQTAVAMQSK